MIDPTRLLGGLLSQGMRRKKGGLAGLGGGFGGAGKVALGMGALGVAMAAFEHFMQQRQPPQGVAPGSSPGAPPPPPGAGYGTAPPPPPGAGYGTAPPPPPGAGYGTAPPPPPGAGYGTAPPPPPAAPSMTREQQESLLLVRAMIAAAYADGQLDAGERDAIVGRLADAGLGQEERAFLANELLTPPPLEMLLKDVNRPELAEAFYAASLLAIRVDTEAERQYLSFLAARLGLPPETVARLHAAAGVA